VTVNCLAAVVACALAWPLLYVLALRRADAVERRVALDASSARIARQRVARSMHHVRA
jgi:hypothetical protein